MMPRLQAEESLLWTTRFAMASGALKPEAASSTLRHWEHIAEMGTPRSNVRRTIEALATGPRPLASVTYVE
jgi:hypothetical protein